MTHTFIISYIALHWTPSEPVQPREKDKWHTKRGSEREESIMENLERNEKFKFVFELKNRPKDKPRYGMEEEFKWYTWRQ